jgi:hypothetical protein
VLMKRRHRLLGLSLLMALLGVASDSESRAAGVQDKPYVEEWVYRVKWGHADEFFDIFKKYQIRILDRLQELGYVTHYTVYRPGLHTAEEERWEYTVLIVYRNQQASTHEAEIERQLFPDRATLKREENHRWELVESHWDLPIEEVDPHAPEP